MEIASDLFTCPYWSSCIRTACSTRAFHIEVAALVINILSWWTTGSTIARQFTTSTRSFRHSLSFIGWIFNFPRRTWARTITHCHTATTITPRAGITLAALIVISIPARSTNTLMVWCRPSGRTSQSRTLMVCTNFIRVTMVVCCTFVTCTIGFMWLITRTTATHIIAVFGSNCSAARFTWGLSRAILIFVSCAFGTSAGSRCCTKRSFRAGGKITFFQGLVSLINQRR